MKNHSPLHILNIAFSRFDLTVWLVVIGLIMSTVLLAITTAPRARGMSIAYLSPAYGGLQNIWITPLDNPDGAEQLTDSEGGIYNFSVSPDGRRIAYADRSPDTGLSDLFMLDLVTGQIQALTRCREEDADCKTPVFHPSGDSLIYERIALNSSIDTLGPGAIRVWTINLNSQPYTTQPLFEDSQIIGYSPIWSNDGSTVAMYSADIAHPGVLVYNFEAAEGDAPLKFVPTMYGTVGTLSPNGKRLIFPEIIQSGDQMFTHLRIANLDELSFDNLTPPEAPIDDIAAQWHPDGTRAAIERRYTDERWTRGHQIYLLDIASGELEPLVYDDRYSHGFFEWDATGERLLMQRFPLVRADGTVDTEARPEIWVRQLEDDSLMQIAGNAFHPRWVTP